MAAQTVVMLLTVSQDTDMNKTDIYEWFSSFKNKKSFVNWRSTSFELIINYLNRWKHHKKSWTYLGRPLLNDWLMCPGVLPMNFEWRIVYATSCSKICAPLAQRRSEAITNKCVLWTERTVGRWSRSSYEGYHWWQELVIQIQHRNKAAIKSMRAFSLTTPHKSTSSKINVKMMLICFFNAKGIVNTEFVPPCQTVNQTFHFAVLRCLWDVVR